MRTFYLVLFAVNAFFVAESFYHDRVGFITLANVIGAALMLGCVLFKES